MNKLFAILCLVAASSVSAQAPPGLRPPQATIDGMAILNSQRRAAGLHPFERDDQLMVGAMDKCSRSANGRFRGHLGGSFYGANREGCGMSSRFAFRTCYAQDSFPAGTKAGAAMVRAPDGWHSLLLIKGSPNGRRSGRVFRRFRLFR